MLMSAVEFQPGAIVEFHSSLISNWKWFQGARAGCCGRVGVTCEAGRSVCDSGGNRTQDRRAKSLR